MRITVDQSAIMPAAALAAEVASAGSGFASAVWLDSDGETLAMYATDAEVTAHATLTVSGEPGAVAVNARGLVKILRGLSGTVTLTADEHGLTVSAGGSRSRLNRLADDAPPAPDVGEDTSADAAAVAAALSVGYCASQNDSRPAITGVYLSGPHATATDGHRLARVTAAAPLSVTGILHRRGAQILRSLLTGAETVAVASGRTASRWTVGRTQLWVRQIDQAFPDADKVIPAPGAAWQLPVDDLIAAVRRVTALFGGRDNILRLTMGDDVIALDMAGFDIGDAHDEVDAPGATGGLVGVNPKYLLEALAHLGSDVSWQPSDKHGPIVLRSPTALAVLMPMRI